MMRAAAKNHESVLVVSDPEQYSELLEELAANEGATGPDLRRRYAAEAFRRTSVRVPRAGPACSLACARVRRVYLAPAYARRGSVLGACRR